MAHKMSISQIGCYLIIQSSQAFSGRSTRRFQPNKLRHRSGIRIATCVMRIPTAFRTVETISKIPFWAQSRNFSQIAHSLRLT